MSEFATRDPARADFWDERYTAGFMPWDAGGVPPELLARAPITAPARVLVPGCGRAYEAGWLAERGYRVAAIDISPVAVAQARAVLGPRAEVVREADFFADDFGLDFDWIYERAFLCALPPRLWADWAKRCAELLRPGGVLAGYFVLAEAVPEPRRGPPFVTSRAELLELLGRDFEPGGDAGVVSPLPVFEGERWFAWIRR